MDQTTQATIREERARAAVAAARSNMSKEVARWPNDANMQQMAREDYQSLRAVFRLYAEGNLSEAVSKASSLDSVVRDSIPDDIWEDLITHNDNRETAQQKLGLLRGHVRLLEIELERARAHHRAMLLAFENAVAADTVSPTDTTRSVRIRMYSDVILSLHDAAKKAAELAMAQDAVRKAADQ